MVRTVPLDGKRGQLVPRRGRNERRAAVKRVFVIAQGGRARSVVGLTR